MKFSQLAVSAFLASAAVAVPVAEPGVVTVVETAQTVAYVTDVENVYVTVAASQEPTATPVASDDAAAAVSSADVAYVEATVFVDQFGNSITPSSDSAAPATATETSVSSTSKKGHGHRHKHKSTTDASSDLATATVSIGSSIPASSSVPTSSSAPVTSQVQIESSSSAPAPTSSSISSDVVVITTQVQIESSSAPAPTSTSDSPDVVIVTVNPDSTTTFVSEYSAPAPVTSTVEEVTTSSAAPTDVAQAVETEDDAAAAVPTSTSSSSSSSSSDSFESSCVDLHNTLRAKHSAEPVTWNSTLSDYATNYLNNQNCVFDHSGGPYGENIAMGYSSATDAIQAWYDENKDYDYSAGQFSMDTGHFTQVVWKDTKQIGCATYDCGDNGAFFACEYYPVGNVIGFFVQNVSP